MTILQQVAAKIIKEQELVIGPLAWIEAAKVPGLKVVNQNNGEVSLEGDESEAVNKLVSQYERLFGRASREVCREAARSLISGLSPSEIPVTLQ
jgi:hypothetical protein